MNVIAYPGDRPPMLCPAPADPRGLQWNYSEATPGDARLALEYHYRRWPDREPDPDLAALADEV